MSLTSRDVLSFPSSFGLNLTRVRHFNYSLYSNATLSNSSHCWVTTPPLFPASILPNGTFINGTWCYHSIRPIGPRGIGSIALSTPFILALVLVFVSLEKHGRTHLPAGKRFRPVGRRWPWYWGIFTCALGIIGLLMNVDIERTWVLDLPIILTSFMWFLMQMGTMALVWEAVRHWGTWEERKIVDAEPFSFRDDDRRSKVEFWLPLWFYLWVWLNFFMIIPRGWDSLKLQRSPEQTASEAEPMATDLRFKTGGFCLFIAWLTIVFSLHHSIRHYTLRKSSFAGSTVFWIRHVPLRFFIMIPLLLALVGYQTFSAFDFSVSLLNATSRLPVVFAAGYGPTLLILFAQIAFGLLSQNEDKQIIQQRIDRGVSTDHELGIIRKPAWWRRAKEDQAMNMKDRIAKNVRELGGGRATRRHINDRLDPDATPDTNSNNNDEAILPYGTRTHVTGSSSAVSRGRDTTRSRTSPYAGHVDPAPGTHGQAASASETLVSDDSDDDEPPPYSERESRPRRRSSSGSTTTAQSIRGPAQQVRSMLDV